MGESPELPAADTTSLFPPPTLTEPYVSVVLHEEPKKRRTGLFIGVGVLALTAIASAGFVLLKDDTAEAKYSLAEASAAAVETKAAAFTMTMELMGEEVTANAETDSTSGLSHLTMELGIVDGSIEMILDTKEQAIYFNSAFLAESGIPVDTKWVKMDQEFLQGPTGGTNQDLFDAADLGNPLDAGAVFKTAKSVTEIGFDEVDGVKVKHFEVVVDTVDAMKVSPQLRKQLDELGGDIPQDLTYDVYVDEQNQILRITTDASVAGQKISVDIVIKPQAEPIVIEVPEPADVTDFADLI